MNSQIKKVQFVVCHSHNDYDVYIAHRLTNGKTKWYTIKSVKTKEEVISQVKNVWFKTKIPIAEPDLENKKRMTIQIEQTKQPGMYDLVIYYEDAYGTDGWYPGYGEYPNPYSVSEDQLLSLVRKHWKDPRGISYLDGNKTTNPYLIDLQ